jgi:hypothetical protein
VADLDQRIANQHRPSWAIGIALAAMHAAHRQDCAQNLVDQLTEIALHESRWPEAHATFTLIRRAGLELDRSGLDPVCARLLWIVEACAKVTYNASGAPAPFDANSGEKLVRWAGELAATLDHASQASIWRAVTFGEADL